MILPSNAIIVTEKEYFPLLFSFRKSHPEVAFKLWDKDMLFSRLSFTYMGNPIPYLLRAGMDYTSAKKWMRILRYGDVGVSPRCQELLALLPKEIIGVDPLGEYEIAQGSICLLEMSNDNEVHSLLKRKGVPYTELSLQELDIPVVTELGKEVQVVQFQNKYEQFSFIFASLREGFLNHSYDQTLPRIFVKDDADAFFLRSIGSLYGIETCFDVQSTLFSSASIAEACQQLYAAKSFDLSALNEEAYKVIEPIVKEYGLAELDFPTAYASLYEILNATKKRISLGEKGVEVTSSFHFASERLTYLTCMQHGTFYKEFTDDDVLSDEELLALGLNTSYAKTSIAREIAINFLKYNRFALISRVKEHLDEKIYDAQIAEEYHFQKVSGPAFNEPFGVHSSAAKNLFHMRELDRQFFAAPYGGFHTYDSRFKGLSSYHYPKDHYSVTDLEKYVRCPYQYYLNSLLPRSDDDARPRYAGVMVHKVLEGVYQENHDLEEAIQEGVKAYLDERDSRGDPALPYDEVLIELTKTNLRRYVPLVRAQTQHSHIVATYSEKRVKWTLEDDHGSYPFSGCIDAILVGEKGKERYYILLDYKTGSEEFRPYEAFLGASIQLPLYALALMQNNFHEEIDARFGGMGLKHVAFPGIQAMFKNDDHQTISLKTGYQSLRAEGVFSREVDFWEIFDDTGLKVEKKQTVPSGKGVFLYAGDALFDRKGEGTLASIPRTKGIAYSLDELLLDAKTAAISAINHIRAGDFPMAPSPSDLRAEPKGDNLTCRYCAYKDICYRVLSRDAKDYSKDVAGHFKKKKEEKHG